MDVDKPGAPAPPNEPKQLKNGAESSTNKLVDTKPLASESAPLTLVGVGASAGGVEALEQLFAAMPDETDMAFVVIQHLSPDFKSLMPQILARQTNMPVVKIENGLLAKPNHVYVLPSGEVAEIDGHRFVTLELNREKHAHPIDHFFKTLADSMGEDAVGIILSGTGSDGAKGVREIHQRDGLVIAQSEESCKFNGMPRAAISTGIVDAIVPPEQMPETLKQFSEILSEQGRSRHSVFVESMDAEKRIHQLLHQRFGLDLDQYKQGMVGRRITRRVILEDQPSIEAYLQLLESSEQALSDLYQDLLIGVTEFFRDPQAFSELQLRVLPQLIDEVKDDSGKLRVWIVPCATGEEAYSVAILIDELLSQRSLDLDVKIFATDVNTRCVEFAGRGVYPKARLANVSQGRLRRYFVEQDGTYTIIPRLRKQIVFASHNMLKDAPFTKLNLVCCRNFMIYLKPAAKKKALSLINFALSPLGVLFLGPSETTTELESAFQLIDPNWQLYRKAHPVRFSEVGFTIGSMPKHSEGKTSLGNYDPGQKLLPVYDVLLDEFMPNGILVNSENQILHLFGQAHSFLCLKRGRPTDNLFEMLPAPFDVAVPNGLRRVKIENQPACYPGLEFEIDGELRKHKLVIKKLPQLASENFLITIEECSNSVVSVGRDAEAAVDDVEVVNSLSQELRETRDSLHDTILKLRSANEDMQSTNEELIASNEELQSTNEELHSVNEELYTVNAEHQRKITELTEMTDDMDNLLDSLQVDTIFLDHELRIRKFTLGFADSFQLLPQDVGRKFSSFNHGLNIPNLMERIQQVLATTTSFETDVQDAHGNWFLMRILPYNARGKIEGVLLTLIEISDIKKTEQRLEELSEIVEASHDAIFRVSVEGKVRTWNRGGENMFLHDSKNVLGKSVAVLGLDEQSEGAFTKSLHQMVCGQPTDRLDLKANRRNGEEFDVAATISPIYDGEGRLDGASVVLRDITSQLDAQRQIQEQVENRDHFLAVLSHELRNPTAAIVNASAILTRADSKKSQRTSANEVIGRHSQQLAKMMDDLLHVARVTHNKINLDLQPVDLVASAHQVVECIEARIAEKDHTLKLEFPSKPLIINADVTRIIQAQTNLLVNACKYTPVGGQIVYSIFPEDDQVVIQVSDDGEGMSADLLKRIFEVFVQADETLDRSGGGMGLGLPLVKMIAKAHGGAILALSKGQGLGSVFELRLPFDKALGDNSPPHVLENWLPLEPRRIAIRSKENTNSLTGSTVLLVEDNVGAREMLAGYLRLEGFEVLTARNGIEGIEIFEKCGPALCVVDIGLPDLNGFEFAKRARSKRPEIVLFALTGYGQSSDRIKVKEAGFDLHLVKPIQPDQVSTEIERFFNASSIDVEVENASSKK